MVEAFTHQVSVQLPPVVFSALQKPGTLVKTNLRRQFTWHQTLARCSWSGEWCRVCHSWSDICGWNKYIKGVLTRTAGVTHVPSSLGSDYFIFKAQRFLLHVSCHDQSKITFPWAKLENQQTNQKSGSKGDENDSHNADLFLILRLATCNR